MSITRRGLGRWAVTAVAAAAVPSFARSRLLADDPLPIVDTHQHLWDPQQVSPPWLETASPLLRQRYETPEYLEATRGLNVEMSVYMEVDVDPKDHVREAETIIALCREGKSPTRAAVIGGRPESPGFADYVARFRGESVVKGVRQVLHRTDTPPGMCLRPAYVKGVSLLGEAGLCFDICLRPGELADGVKLVDRCPGTRFVLDHCGNADPSAFQKGVSNPPHDPEAWTRDMVALAKRPNVVCKISGVIARAPRDGAAEAIRPIIDHCLDSFGFDRVMFGGDWPVCLQGSSYRGWVEALRSIVSRRSLADRRKLWRDNAVRFYRLST